MRYGYISLEGWVALACCGVLAGCLIAAGGQPPSKNLEPVIGIFGLGALILTTRWLKNRLWLARTSLRSQAWYDGRQRASRARRRGGRLRSPKAHTLDWAGWFHWKQDQVAFSRGKHKGHLLRDVAEKDRSYLEWMLREQIPADTDRIVRDALTGKLPMR